MSATGVTSRGRRAAERLMVDRCDIGRPGEPVTDPETGKVTVPVEPVYSGRCKLQGRSAWPSTPDAGDHAWTLVTIEVHIPATTTGVRTGDIVEITRSIDPTNLGRRFLVKSADLATFRTAVRLLVEEVTG